MVASQMGISRPVLHRQLLPNPQLAGGRLRIGNGPSLRFQEQMPCFQRLSLASNPFMSQKMKLLVPRAFASPTEGLSSRSREISDARLENTSIRMWELFPEPLRVFPWKKAFKRVIQRLFNPVLEAAKWLLIPVLVLTSLMEISYCIVENKELVIPIAMLAGCAFAEILKETAIELIQNQKEQQFPWHLLIIGLLFALIKIPGPYYPYWGRIFLPHFANGGLWQTIWLAKNWYKKPFEDTEVESSSEIYSKSGSGSSEVAVSSEVYSKQEVALTHEIPDGTNLAVWKRRESFMNQKDIRNSLCTSSDALRVA